MATPGITPPDIGRTNIDALKTALQGSDSEAIYKALRQLDADKDKIQGTHAATEAVDILEQLKRRGLQGVTPSYVEGLQAVLRGADLSGQPMGHQFRSDVASRAAALHGVVDASRSSTPADAAPPPVHSPDYEAFMGAIARGDIKDIVAALRRHADQLPEGDAKAAAEQEIATIEQLKRVRKSARPEVLAKSALVGEVAQTLRGGAAAAPLTAAAAADVDALLAGFEKAPLRDRVAILLNDEAGISAETRAAVRARATELGIYPSEMYDRIRAHFASAAKAKSPEIMTEFAGGIGKFGTDHPEFASATPTEKAVITELLKERDKLVEAVQADPEKLRGLRPDEMALLMASPAEIMSKYRTAADVDARVKELHKTNPQIASVVDDLRAARAKYDRLADNALLEIQSLLRSGMPIEVVIMLVMTRLAEKHEENLRVKLQEAAATEAFERHNATQRELAKGGIPAQELNPADFGIPTKSSTVFMQELQVYQQQYMQIMQALSAVIRQIQDMIQTPIRNIR